jgi:hypothetical protein
MNALANQIVYEQDKPWTVAQFEHNRSHMTNWVVTTLVPIMDNPQNPRVVIRAPVKSGKREIVEYMAMRDASHTSPRVHAFLSAWHRAADEEQRNELKLHNMKVFSITKKAAADECLKWIIAQIALGKVVVIHLDECDHGSGEKQILGKVYKRVRELPQVFTILYSATPQEVLFSKEVSDPDEDEMLDDMLYGVHVEYTPPAAYCGPARFLHEDLVVDAKQFFTTRPAPALTEQGRDIIAQLRASTASGSGRNIMTLRLTKKEGKTKNGKEIYKFLQNSHLIPELQGILIMVDKSDYDGDRRAEKIEWSFRDYWRRQTKDVPIVIVMDQTSSRSTEWACHDRIFATHDYRTACQYAILSQAQERVNHYDSKYAGGFQPIKIYGHKKTFELSAGRITYEQYFACPWVMRKVHVARATRGNLGEVYEIKDESGRLHPNFQQPLPKAQAEEVLKELGCFADVSLSSRVAGSVRRLPKFDTHWFRCTATTWITDIARQRNVGNFAIQNVHNPFNHTFNNPFNHPGRPPPGPDGKELGYLRTWKVFDYETEVNNRGGGGNVTIGAPRITICYKDNVLGAAVRWHTGEFRDENRLNAYRSMYPSRPE